MILVKLIQQQSQESGITKQMMFQV